LQKKNKGGSQMKKKILLISGIVIFVAIIAVYVAKVAFVEANKDADVNLEMSEAEAEDLYNMPQTKDENGKYEKLTENEIKVLSKYYTLGDVKSQGVDKDNRIDTDDAKTALNIYVKTSLGQKRNQTKGEIFTADLNGDGEVSVDDAQILLLYAVAKPHIPNVTLQEYVSNKMYLED
jgi:hypothetical protein